MTTRGSDQPEAALLARRRVVVSLGSGDDYCRLVGFADATGPLHSIETADGVMRNVGRWRVVEVTAQGECVAERATVAFSDAKTPGDLISVDREWDTDGTLGLAVHEDGGSAIVVLDREGVTRLHALLGSVLAEQQKAEGDAHA